MAGSPAGALLEALVHAELNEKTWPRFYDLTRIAAEDDVAIETLNVPAGESIGADWKRDHSIT